MMINSALLMVPLLFATSSILLLNHGAQSQGFGRRLGLADFATNDLLRHARASTSSDEFEYPSVQSRQLPAFEQSVAPKQRSLRPVLRQQSPPKGRRNVSKNRNRLNRYRSSEEGSSNFVQEGWPEDIRKNKRDGARYDENGNRVKRPTTNKVPRQNVQHLLIQKQRPNQARPLIKVQKKGYPQQQSSIRSQGRRGEQNTVDKRLQDPRLAVLATPDAGYAASSSQPTFAPQRYPENEERYVQQDQRPSYNYRRPSSEYQEIPNESSSIRRRVDPTLQAVIEDVVPNTYPASQPDYPSSNDDEYEVSSAPAFGSPSNRRDSIVESPYGYQIPAEQKNLQAAVLSGANAYGDYAGRQNPGVYQNEDRLSFQIHGHDGPHSYRYGYDTGNGYNRQFRYEERNGAGHLKGRYGFFDKYGELKVVNYSADPYAGFHAEGAGVPEYPH